MVAPRLLLANVASIGVSDTDSGQVLGPPGPLTATLGPPLTTRIRWFVAPL